MGNARMEIYDDLFWNLFLSIQLRNNHRMTKQTDIIDF